MQSVFGGRIYFLSYRNNVLDTRKIVTDEETRGAPNNLRQAAEAEY